MTWQFSSLNRRQFVGASLAASLGGFFSSSLQGASFNATSATLLGILPQLKPGDVCNLASGIYPAIDTNSVSLASGTASAPITFNGSSGVVFKGSGIACLNLGNKGYLVFNNIKTDGSNLVNTVSSLGDGVSLYGSHHCKFNGCEFYNAPGNGVITHDSTQKGDYNEFINCNSHDNGYENAARSRVAHGYYIITDHNLIQGGSSSNNYGYGIHCYNSGGGPDYNLFSGVKASSNGRGPYANASVAGIILSQGTGNQAIGCETTGNKGPGIQVDYSSIGAVVRGCKTSGNGATTGYPDIDITASAKSTLVENNCVVAARIRNAAGAQTTLINNSPTACGGSIPTPPPATNVNVSQNPPASQPTQQQPPIVATSPPPLAPPPTGGTSGANLGLIAAFVVGGVVLASLSKD